MDNLKEHIKETKTLTEKYEQEAEKLSIVKEEVFDLKLDILGSAFGKLVTKLFETVDEWVKINSEKVQQGNELGVTIKNSIEKILTTISQQKAPDINFQPKVNVDLSSLTPIIEEFNRGQSMIIPLLQKMVNGNDSSALQNLIATLVQRQLTFLEREIKHPDYSKELKSISDGMNRGMKGEVTSRDNAGRLVTWVMEPK